MPTKQLSDFATASRDPVPPVRFLAHEYRPSTFSDLIGHGPAIKEIAAAIGSDLLPDAILLSGIRGVGKTSTARLIAKAHHCVGIGGRGGITAEPCGQCIPCILIANGAYPDALDIDCTSRSHEIGDVISALHNAPPAGRPRICFFDEVHRLDQDAVAALIRALEAPPPNTKLILATWLPDTLAPEILNRCRKFELRPVSPQRLAAHLARVCKAEGKTPDPQMLAVVAAQANGSVRQALLVLDGLLSIDRHRLQDWAHLRHGARKLNKRKRIQADRLRQPKPIADRSHTSQRV